MLAQELKSMDITVTLTYYLSFYIDKTAIDDQVCFSIGLIPDPVSQFRSCEGINQAQMLTKNVRFFDMYYHTPVFP